MLEKSYSFGKEWECKDIFEVKGECIDLPVCNVCVTWCDLTAIPKIISSMDICLWSYDKKNEGRGKHTTNIQENNGHSFLWCPPYSQKLQTTL